MIVPFKTMMEKYPAMYSFPTKTAATECIRRLISGVGPDPELFQIASDLLVESVRPNSAGDVAMRAAEIILDLRRELAKLKGT